MVEGSLPIPTLPGTPELTSSTNITSSADLTCSVVLDQGNAEDGIADIMNAHEPTNPEWWKRLQRYLVVEPRASLAVLTPEPGTATADRGPDPSPASDSVARATPDSTTPTARTVPGFFCGSLVVIPSPSGDLDPTRRITRFSNECRRPDTE